MWEWICGNGLEKVFTLGMGNVGRNRGQPKTRTRLIDYILSRNVARVQLRAQGNKLNEPFH